jgi:hypothetical protein
MEKLELPKGDDIQLAIIAHRFAPAGTGERIFAQNYLFSYGLYEIVEKNNEQQRRDRGCAMKSRP